MEPKYAILAVTALCVMLIVVEELYQSHLYNSRWRIQKSRLVATYATESFKEENKSPPFDKAAENQQERVKDDEYIKNHKGYFEQDDVWSLQRWKEWVVKVHGKSTKAPKKVEKGGMKQKRKKIKQRLLLDNNAAENLTEDERLRRSPYIYHEQEELEKARHSLEVERGIKYITHFLPWELEENTYRPSFDRCRYKNCAFVDDMTKADLVAFKAATIRDHDILTFQRPKGQRWMMYTIDPALRGFTLGREDVKSLFNATSTYNLDADVPLLFGSLRKVLSSNTTDYGKIYDGKTKMAAWFVSHCKTGSKREDFVQRMQTVMEVNIFGQCGNFTCGHGHGPESRKSDRSVCLPMLSSDYFFYLAFENAYCLDYVTEKFFKLFRYDSAKVIPVVRGAFQYKKYLPSGMFVNADDFETPEELAKYLIDLTNDKERYVEMLKKKDEWRLVLPPSRHCNLCEYLHSNPPEKFYPDLSKKFGPDSCWSVKTV